MWTRLAAVAALSTFIFGCGAAEPEDELVGTVQEAVSAPLAAAYCTAQVIGKGAKSTEDDYLPHVITCENGGANLEALKAQAIAARSVLYYNMATSGSICDSQGCQVYSCGAAPQAKHYQAVKETAGMYLSYAGTLTYGFYVAGDSGVKAPSCKDYSGSTTKYITYNEGKTGTAVKQTSLGWIGPAGNGQNRGCMGQWGARCLENHKGYDYKQILRFYYGADVQILKATGPCTKGCEPTHCEGSKMVSACGKGDCAAFGADCVKDSLGVRCVSVFCPAKGKTKACMDDSFIIDCNDGAPSEPGDCSAYAAYCSTAGVSSARCVSAFCVKGPNEVPKAHDICMPDGTLAHCTEAGLPEGAKACPSGTKCVAKNGGAFCEVVGSGTAGAGGLGGAGGSAGSAGAGLAGAPWENPDPSGGESSSHQTRVASADDGGCRMAAPPGHGRRMPWLLMLAASAVLALRRRRVAREVA